MSKISSYPTLSSSTTQAIYNLFIPNATGLISYSFFHTNPSNSIAKIFFATAFKSYSASNTLTSNIIIDFATGFSFFFAYYSYYFFLFQFFCFCFSFSIIISKWIEIIFLFFFFRFFCWRLSLLSCP